MREAFIEKKFQKRSMALLNIANAIIEEYQEQGLTLTVRQLYYQFVARDIIENSQRSYKRLVNIVNDGRMAGYLDWNAIEDRTRHLERNLHLRDPRHGLELLRDQWYGIDMWENQDQRVEVWIEKEALIGVIEDICEELDVPYFACRGYVSQSEAYKAYQRHGAQQPTVMLHLGDHDPSGIDMTRDNQDRLDLFHGFPHTEVKRIALNMDQVEQYEPPPNPGKQKDPRFEEYYRIHGGESWELDALDPPVLIELIRNEVDKIRDMDLWQEKEEELELGKETLSSFIDQLED